ncbi:MAG: hypothetical protein IT328_04600 [Caldilineaceae bacterium]|nr:hypothetical protein [Caldilineaceae bacterium]
MPLDDDQLLDMRGDLGIGPEPAVFTNTQLQRLYTRAGENYNTAVYMAWLQVQAGTVGWIDYKVAQTSMSRNQAYQHVKEMVAHWGNMPGVSPAQVKMVGLVQMPPRDKREPNEGLEDYYDQLPYRRHLGY